MACRGNGANAARRPVSTHVALSTSAGALLTSDQSAVKGARRHCAGALVFCVHRLLKTCRQFKRAPFPGESQELGEDGGDERGEVIAFYNAADVPAPAKIHGFSDARRRAEVGTFKRLGHEHRGRVGSIGAYCQERRLARLPPSLRSIRRFHRLEDCGPQRSARYRADGKHVIGKAGIFVLQSGEEHRCGACRIDSAALDRNDEHRIFWAVRRDRRGRRETYSRPASARESAPAAGTPLLVSQSSNCWLRFAAAARWFNSNFGSPPLK